MIKHVAIFSIRTHIGANKVLELRTVGTTGVFVLTKDSSLVGNLDITPLAVEVQPVDGIAWIVPREHSGDVVIAVCVVVPGRIPKCAVAGIIVDWTEGEIETGDRVVVNPEASQKLLI